MHGSGAVLIHRVRFCEEAPAHKAMVPGADATMAGAANTPTSLPNTPGGVATTLFGSPPASAQATGLATPTPMRGLRESPETKRPRDITTPAVTWLNHVSG